MEIKIDGLEQLIKMLNSLDADVQKYVYQGRDDLAKLIQGQAKLLAPVDEGQLRNSIELHHIEDTAVVGTNVEHAMYNEFGTGQFGDPKVPHTTKKYWRYKKDGRFYTTHGMEPRPFMRPAAKFGEKHVLEIFKKAFERGLKHG